MPVSNCRHFSGYKPCTLNSVCDTDCPHMSVAKTRILIVHLEALGAVLRSTAILEPIKAKYPDSHVTWVTKKPGHLLLENLKSVDRILTTTPEDILALSALDFDVALAVDKSLASAGVLRQTRVDKIFGFIADPKTGGILPATEAATELWDIGLSDQKKFFENKKTETQLICEALELPFSRSDYQVQLSSKELEASQKLRNLWAPNGEYIVGLNTGCAPMIPYKKLTVEFHRALSGRLKKDFGAKVVLLGGAEDTDRNKAIAQGLDVISSSTDKGIRDGFTSMNAVDCVITGDSLGMHMAIGLKKWVVAWFGPTCGHEIDLFERGVHVLTTATCSPCWKRSCDKNPMCYDLVDIEQILNAVQKGMQWRTETGISSTKQPSLATYSSPLR